MTPHQPESSQTPDAAPQAQCAGAASSHFGISAYSHQAAHLAGVNSNNYLQSQIRSLVLIQLLNYFLYSSSSYSADKEIKL